VDQAHALRVVYNYGGLFQSLAIPALVRIFRLARLTQLHADDNLHALVAGCGDGGHYLLLGITDQPLGQDATQIRRLCRQTHPQAGPVSLLHGKGEGQGPSDVRNLA